MTIVLALGDFIRHRHRNYKIDALHEDWLANTTIDLKNHSSMILHLIGNKIKDFRPNVAHSLFSVFFDFTPPFSSDILNHLQGTERIL